MVRIRTPGSCGELIQGFYGGNEMLISYPVNIFSDVEIKYGSMKDSIINTKGMAAVKSFFKFFNIPDKEIENLNITVGNGIPIGKGMASSTADIAGIIFGLSKHFNFDISSELLSKFCVEIEPTDSIIFEKLSLFDHINGVLVEDYDWELDFKVLCLEPNQRINTVDFRSGKEDFFKSKNQNSKALDKFREAYMKKSYDKLAEATLDSAFENQEILEKPYIKKIIKIMEKNYCYGLNVAHSGTVIGIMYDEVKVDIEKLIYDLKEN